MKPLKKAAQKNVQKNVQVNKDFYTVADIADLLEIAGIFELSSVSGDSADEGDYRVSLAHVKDLKVMLGEDGYYSTVAVMESGETVFVSL